MEQWLFIAKGVLGLVGIVLLTYHMNRIIGRMESRAQALRYLSLLMFATAVFYASAEQLWTRADWQSRHSMALAATVLLIVAAVCSIMEDHAPRR